MPSSSLWTCSFSHPPPVSLSPSESPCRSQETGLLPLRQTPSRSQVELPVTMRQPLETDGLQTACHVYCCCYKRQESNNTLPQEAYGIAQGLANSCLGGSIGPVHSHTRTHTHFKLNSYLNYQPNAIIAKYSHILTVHTDIKTSKNALQMSSTNLSGHATFTTIKQACHLNI